MTPNLENPRTLDLRTFAASEGVSEIRLAAGETLVAFAVPEPDSPIRCRFELADGAKLLLRSLIRPGTSAELSVLLGGFGSEADVRAVAISEGGKTSNYVSRTVSAASKTRASSEVSAFSLSHGDLSITTVAEIGEGVSGAYAEAVQSNVLFGEAGKIRGIPELRIASDDVKARHSCSVERFSDEKLFYLRSRGMEKDDAVATLVSSKISKAFSGLPESVHAEGDKLCLSAIGLVARK